MIIAKIIKPYIHRCITERFMMPSFFSPPGHEGKDFPVILRVLVPLW